MMKVALSAETSNDITENTSVHVSNYAEEATVLQEDPPGEIFDLFKELIRLSKNEKHVIAEIKLRTANYLFSSGCDISKGGDFNTRVENFANCYLKCISLEETNSLTIPSNSAITYNNNWEIYDYYQNYRNTKNLERVRELSTGKLSTAVNN